MRRLSLLVVIVLFAYALASCVLRPIVPPAGQPSGAAADKQELVIFAAASLTDAIEELVRGFQDQAPGATVVTNYAGSSSLATQLLEGASADIFAPANQSQMERVSGAGLLAADPLVFATNELVAVVPVDNPAGVEAFRDLAKPGVRLVLAFPGVPVRDYTDDLMRMLADDPAYGTPFVDALQANVVSEEANVRQVLAKVALGEADAGIVYASDLTPQSAEGVSQISLPAGYRMTALYPIAALTGGREPDLAARFIEFALSDDGQAILQSWGFGQRIE